MNARSAVPGGRRSLLPLALGTALIALATLTPAGTGEGLPPRWCVRCGSYWLTDAVSNVLLFVPFGAAVAARVGRGARMRGIAVALACGALVSLAVELLQAAGLPGGRSPAVADLLANSLGAAMGGALVALWPLLSGARDGVARRLLALWTLGVVMIGGLTAIALGPRGSEPTGGAARWLPSELRHAPGMPFFGGGLTGTFVDSARLDGTVWRRGFAGPILLATTDRPTTLRALVVAHGADSLVGRVPLLFAHGRGEQEPVLMVAEHGTDAELWTTRRAWDWGLMGPSVTVPGVFRGRAEASAAALAFEASVTPDRLVLVSRRLAEGARPAADSLILTPALGWMLAQSVVGPQDPGALVVAALWIGMLAFGLGWWGRRSFDARVPGWCMAGGALVAVSVAWTLAARWVDIHPPLLADAIAGTLGTAGGVVAAGWRRRDRADRTVILPP